MLKSLNKVFFTNKYHIVLNIVAILIVLYYFQQNWHSDAVLFLVVAYAKFLVFTNIYYVLMFFRYRFYNSIRNLTIIRLSEKNYYENIFKYESLILAGYFFLVYIIGAFILGTDHLMQYVVLVLIFGLALCLTHAIHFIVLIWKKNIYIYHFVLHIFF